MHRRDADVWLWRDWPAEYRDPRSPAVAQFAQEHSRDVLFFKFLQWHIDRQLAEAQAHALDCGMKIGLYHDLALATDRFGADLWANRPFYAAGCRVGAPPDDFSPNGQDWGFPPPNRDAHRADGYRAVRAIDPQERAARRRAAHRSRHALLPAVLDSGRHACVPTALTFATTPTICWGFWRSKARAQRIHRDRGRSGHGDRRSARGAAPKPAS